MMKKNNFAKITACALTALAVATAPYLSVLAADAGTTTASSDTKVKYDVTQSYVWTVTDEIDFTSNDITSASTKNGKIDVTNNVIGYGNKLRISVKGNESDGSFKITNTADNTTKLSYTIQKGSDAVATGGVALEVPAGELTKTQELTFTLSADEKKKAKYAGEYSGTATFTAEVVTNSAN